MSRWRVALLVGLFVGPWLVLAVLGIYHLWLTGWWFYVWWPLTGCFALGYYLAARWHRKQRLLPKLAAPPMHWTVRDRAAWALVEARANAVKNTPSERLGDPQLYVQAAEGMTLELARHYHPTVVEPVDKLTIPELLAVVELAAHDLSKTVGEYLPGGHILTIGDWKKAQKATDWYKTASDTYWLGALVFDPLRTGARFLASQLGLTMPFQQLQQNLVDWFYVAYLNRVGHYLVELYSGRLRVGATRYRELKAAYDGTADAPTETATAAKVVTVTLLGQVNAGKSSTVNALLGEAKAFADAVPATDQINRYRLPAANGGELLLQDTVGYGHEGPKADQIAATQQAAQHSDLLLLVLHARTAARRADVQMLDALKAWFRDRPNLKMPPVLAVVTHVDLLSPAMEWSPPYHWESPTRPKEQQMAEALAHVRQEFGDRVAAAVPVCTAANKRFGIDEALLPAMAALLGEARMVALLRALHREWDAGQVQKVFGQVAAVGRELFKALWK